MIVYNYSSKPIVISIGIVPDQMGGQGQGETTIILPPEGAGGVDLCAYGIYTKEERLVEDTKKVMDEVFDRIKKELIEKQAQIQERTEK